MTRQEEFDKYFYYDETSSTGLRYKLPTRFKFNIGDEAGIKQYMVKRGNVPHCIRVYLKRKHYQAHRIIWILINGKIPDDHVIDHIDGNPFNNKISNLRCIKSEYNTQNAKRRKDNSTGKTGVHCLVSKHGVKRYIAVWKENGVQKSKSFNCRLLGESTAFELASNYRDKMIELLNEKGELYSERHGKHG